MGDALEWEIGKGLGASMNDIERRQLFDTGRLERRSFGTGPLPMQDAEAHVVAADIEFIFNQAIQECRRDGKPMVSASLQWINLLGRGFFRLVFERDTL